ncbi:hypothetical protein GWI33_004400 [Rhynchophorus ferrugineus]|uniref:Uncharacterized protein n=1 Tax=Rhynchophorus ferrugineus TaxID=354439 RepID=A0A834IQ39_RHYFE|nr:hypothetical protein GWI33_004400 [Rhynchophorus ferrugineus]
MVNDHFPINHDQNQKKYQVANFNIALPYHPRAWARARRMTKTTTNGRSAPDEGEEVGAVLRASPLCRNFQRIVHGNNEKWSRF